MFSKAVACGALLCALLSPVIAGEARTLPGRHRQLVNQHSQLGRSARMLRAEAQKPAWPPALMGPKRPAARQAQSGADGRLGDAFMVDTSVVPGSLFGGMNFSYGAASSGAGWRVFWADDNGQSVYTSGIGSDGSVTDVMGNRVGHEFQAQQSGVAQAIAGTGSGYAAVWTAGENRSIWSARLDSAGNVLDSLLVFDSDELQVYPAIAFDGDSTCLVAWTEDLLGSPDIYAARLTASGRLLDSVPFPVAQGTEMEYCPAIAFGRGVFLVAWTAADTSGTTATAKAIRVSVGGAVLDTAIFLRHAPAVFQACPNVVFGDTCFLATWSEGMEQPDIFAARISASGELIDTAAIQLCGDPDMDLNSSIGFDGTDYLVMWEEVGDEWPSGSLCGRRLTVDGVPLDSDFIRPRLRDYVCNGASVSRNEENFFVACSFFDTTVGNMGVCCARISPDGVVLDSGFALPMSADMQLEPSGAFDGTNFLAVWGEDRGGYAAELSAARIAADGMVLDPVGFPIDTTPTGKSNTAVAFGDSLYLAAWADNRDSTGWDIYCARVGTDGSVFDPGGIPVCRETLDQDYPDISFDGENFLVAWHDNRSNMRGNIYAARVSPAGAVLDPDGFAVAVSDSFDDAAPAVCFTGTDHLVVWRGYHYNTSDDDIYGALVSPAGTIIRPRFLVGGTADYQQLSPFAARGTANSLVAWVQDDGAIYAARVRADGTVLDTNALFVDKSSPSNELPHVIADADGFRVLWDYWGDMDTTHFEVARIDTAGNLVPSDEWFAISGNQLGVDAIAGSGPDLLVFFSCRTYAAFGKRYNSYRLWGRLGEVTGIGDAGNQQANRVTGGATIVRGALFLNGRTSSSASTSLLDISGRKVLNLHPGANDVRALSPGVYFVHEEAQGSGRKPQPVRKVVVTE